ncbi:MAG: hypothetical protein ACOY90_16710 [Candidatus Zhuqueibacterota bacterium]
MKKIILFSAILFIALIAMLSCEVDHGLYPVNYQIQGKVVFFKGEAPENTDRVEVFALKEFPPQDPQNFLYLGSSGALDYSKGNDVSFKINVSPTSYEMIGVLWREKGKDWDLTGLIGFYTGDLQSILPGTVTVSKENPVAKDVTIYANWQTVSKDAHISGDISYAGTWPEDTQLLLLAIYRTKPVSDMNYLLFENVDYTQPIYVDSSSYRLAVNSSVYNYIVLFWVGSSIKNLSDLIPIGFYENANSPGEPGTVDMTFGGEAENIDIHVNFNAIEFP